MQVVAKAGFTVQNHHFIHKNGGASQDRESCFLVCVAIGERSKALLLGKGCMSCACGHSGYGAV